MNPNLTHAEILEQIQKLDVKQYAQTRNHLSGTVSRLSPYITRGVIDLPTVRDTVLQSNSPKEAEKFLQELAWREYFQKVFRAKQEAIFSDIRFERDGWRHHDLVTAITDAETDIQAIDEQIVELFATGYMHNHARMWVAMLACNVAKANWQNMSRWMYYHLLDGDLASNTLSWQWVAGTSVQNTYLANQSLINALSGSQQANTYLDIQREDVGEMDVPERLSTSSPFSLSMSYPTADTIADVSGKKVLLYHPWSIDPQWRSHESGERICIFEPRWFDRFPVSPKVVQYILSLLATHVPTAKIYVGNVETIPGIAQAEVFSKSHPATTHFPGVKDAPAELFPEVQGYYQSFFKFWQACQQSR